MDINEKLIYNTGIFTINRRTVSIGAIQRNFKIGFNTATSVLELLEKFDVIKKYDSSNWVTSMSEQEFNNLYETIILPALNGSVEHQRDVHNNTPQLHQRIEMYNGKFELMTGEDFEQYCALLLSKIGFKNIKFTAQSGDHGSDILAEAIGATYAIQCKCYSDVIGVSAVRDAYVGKIIYKKDVAIVMASNYFTKQAQEEAEILGVKLWDKEYMNFFTDEFYLKNN